MRRWLLISVISAASAVAVDSYQQTIEHWRQQHETTLKADGGWLTVTGLFWLKPGENRAGSDPSNEIALPRGPAHLGEFQLRNGAVSFRPERRGSSSTILKPDTDQSIS